MNIKIKNYKIFSNSEINFKDYNLLAGKNSTGKTSILEVIKLFDNNYENKEMYVEELSLRGKRFDDISNFVNVDRDDIVLEIDDNKKVKIENLKKEEHKVKYTRIGKIDQVSYFKSNRIVSEEQTIDSLNKNVNEDNATNLAHLIKENQIEDEIYEDLKYIFSLDESQYKVKIDNISNPIYTPNYSILFNNMAIENQGFGFKYILPLLVQSSILKNSIIIIENPETYLHPSAQSKLIDKLIEKCKVNSNKLFIETHSDHVINAFRNNIVEGSYAGIYFISKNKEIREIEITADKKYSDFPEDFLEQNIKDLERIYGK